MKVLVCLLILFDTGMAISSNHELGPSFTENEQQYLEAHPVLRVHNERDWPPFNFNADGSPSGYSIDYMDLLAKKIGVRVQYITGPSWDEFLSMMKSGEIDVMLNIVNTKSRRSFLSFTKPYLVTSEVIYTRKNTSGIESLDDLVGKTVALPKGFFTVTTLQEYYPGIKLILVKNARESLEAVAFGRADATVGIAGVMQYLVQKNFIPNLRLAAPVNDSRMASVMNLGVAKENLILRDILQKGMAEITEDEVVTIRQRWEDRQATSVLALSQEEKRFLRAHPIIRAHVERDYAPFLFSKDGRAVGYGVDYLHLLAEKLGIDIDYRNNLNWSEALTGLKQRDIDLVLAMVETPERQRYTTFTSPFLTTYTGIAVRKENRQLNSIEALSGQKVGVVKGYWHGDALKIHFPDITVLTYPDNLTSLEAVSSGEVVATLGSNPVLLYLMTQNYMTDLTTSMIVDERAFKRTEEALGVRSDWPELRDMFNRAIASVTQEELVRLEQKWQLHLPSNTLSLVTFSPEEIRYLKKRGDITICVDPDWLPYEAINQRGEHVGVSADLIQLIAGRLGKNIRVVATRDWEESLRFAKNRKCDMLPLASKTPHRTIYMDFTEPYLSFPNVIATRMDELFVESIEQIHGRRIGVVKGHSLVETLARDYPNLSLVQVESVSDGLEMVRQGNIFGFIGAVATIGQAIQEEDYLDVKITGNLGLTRNLSIGVRNDEPLLFEVIKKVLASVTLEERQQIQNKWIKVKYSAKVDYSFVIQILLVAALITAFFIYRNRSLARYNRKVQFANEEMAEAHRLLMEKTDELARLSITDPLTQIFNRLKLDEIFSQEIQRAERYGKSFSVIMLDIDDFKSINDRFGHQVGDSVLVTLAKTLKEELRVTDTLGRWGGEEFFIICPETVLAGASQVAENLRASIERIQFETMGHVTASFGVATYREGEYENEMIGRADKALYRAKVSGKNQVCLSGEGPSLELGEG